MAPVLVPQWQIINFPQASGPSPRLCRQPGQRTRISYCGLLIAFLVPGSAAVAQVGGAVHGVQGVLPGPLAAPGMVIVRDGRGRHRARHAL